MQSMKDMPQELVRGLIDNYRGGRSARECSDWLLERGFGGGSPKAVADWFRRHEIFKTYPDIDMKMHFAEDPLQNTTAIEYVRSDAKTLLVFWTEQAVLRFIEDFKPEALIDNGDLFDFEAISRFPTSLVKRTSLQDDVDAGRAIIRHQREAAGPDCEIYVTEGNHEARLSKFITANAPELSESPGLTMEDFCGFADFDAKYVHPYGNGVDWHGILVAHGNRVNAHSAGSAKAEFGDSGTSLIMGHTQRLGAYYVTDRTGTHAAFENGCMCRIDPGGAAPSMRGPRVNNWQQGFAVGFADDYGWNIYQVSITNHEFIWGGKRYTPTGK
jgi:hypothetical protein